MVALFADANATLLLNKAQLIMNPALVGWGLLGSSGYDKCISRSARSGCFASIDKLVS